MGTSTNEISTAATRTLGACPLTCSCELPSRLQAVGRVPGLHAPQEVQPVVRQQQDLLHAGPQPAVLGGAAPAGGPLEHEHRAALQRWVRAAVPGAWRISRSPGEAWLSRGGSL